MIQKSDIRFVRNEFLSLFHSARNVTAIIEWHMNTTPQVIRNDRGNRISSPSSHFTCLSWHPDTSSIDSKLFFFFIWQFKNDDCNFLREFRTENGTLATKSIFANVKNRNFFDVKIDAFFFNYTIISCQKLCEFT